MSLSSAPDRQKQHQKQNGKWNNHVGEPSNCQSTISYFVKLAPESPLRKSYDLLPDESSYDSFHNYETDICKDSSDDDFSDANSSHTEGFAVMDVIEYELPDDSESDDVSSASSGSDDFVLKAATAACFQFKELINEPMTDENDDEFIFADTEEDSEGSIDLELGPADYWKCVKCNNRQNTPLYRYCERCYQVRKSLFPPRPRRQKSRAEHSLKRKMTQQSQNYSTTDVESDSDSQIPVVKKIALSPRAECLPTNTSSLGMKNGNQLNNMKDKLNSENSKHANSAGELSCNNNTSSDDNETVSSDQDHVNKNNVNININRDVVRKANITPSTSVEIAKVDQTVVDCTNYSSTTLAKRSPSLVNNVDNLEFKVENKLIQNVYRQELLSHKRPNTLEWKDSGLSSCQESSQEFPFSQSEDGFLVRSSSSGSTRSFDSQNEFQLSQASTQVQQDSDDETATELILARVEEFIQERRENNMKKRAEPTPSSSSGLLLPSSESLIEGSLDVNESQLGLCRFCMVNPKNGAFEHKKNIHLCCCYKCALKVWKSRGSCPICNGKVSSIKKLFVH